jgi:hypothetical protein
MNLEDVILRGTRAGQPAANTVAAGSLYYVTDENVTERSTGAAWEDYSDSGGVAYTDEMAQDAVGAMADAQSLTYTDATPLIEVKVQQSITKDASGLKLSGDSAAPGNDKYYGTDSGGTKGYYALPAGGGGGSDWDSTVTKTSDQTVTNNATLQNDTELVVALLANKVYFVEFFIIYSGNDTTGDYKWQFSGPWNVATQAEGYYVTPNASLSIGITAAGGTVGGLWPAGPVSSGTDAAHSKFVVKGEIYITTNAAGNLQFQFANLSAAAGRESKTWTGSFIRVKEVG